MNTDITFLCFIGVSDWEVFTRRPHLEPLSKFGKLIVVESPVTLRNLGDLFKKKTKNKGNLFVVKPLLLISNKIFRFIPFFEHLYFYLLKKQIMRFVDKDSSLTAMFFKPYQITYLKHFTNCATTFEYSDKFSLYLKLKEHQKELIKIDEKSILREVDTVFATSLMLYSESIKYNKNTFFLPNGVSSRFSCIRLNFPDIEKKIVGPKIGFVGNINEWLDFQLINKLAIKNPNYNFIFVGNTIGSSPGFLKNKHYISSLSISNIFYLGRKPYGHLYSFIQLFDVCCIYYKVDQFKKYVHPNKIYMYLAAGKPVVSTNFCVDLKDYFKNHVSIANNLNEFEALIKRHLYKDDENNINARMQFAKNNFCEKIAEYRYNIIKDNFTNG